MSVQAPDYSNIKQNNMIIPIYIIQLNREKCEIDYIQNGLDFIMSIICESNGYSISDKLQNEIKKEIEVYHCHTDVRDKEMINNLFQYDIDNVNMIEKGSALILFYEDKGRHKEFTIKWSGSKECDQIFKLIS